MKTETEIETVETQPRKLVKPARERAELRREELVTYANESGGMVTTTGFMGTTEIPT